MDTLTRNQVIDRMKRFAMRKFNILYFKSGIFVIKDDNAETTEAFFTKFNSLNTNCECVRICNSVEGPMYQIF